jgi:geranylgeranyl reductase family protein
MIKTDTLIVGAGPGGCATALKLQKQGMSCMLLDKATFPRDKVCGDAISGKVITVLNRVDPEIIKRFKQKSPQEDIWGIRLVAPNDTPLDVPFKYNYKVGEEPAPGYVAKRIDFDNFLVEEVKRCDLVDFREGVEVKEVEKFEDGFRVTTDDGTVIETRLLVMANGAQSAFSRKYAGIPKEIKHYAGAVRAYYSNVTGFHADGFIELHFLKDYIPGYFWAFPLPNGGANVGLGLRTDYISKKKLNLTKSLQDIVANHPVISQRFKNATLESKIVGYPLPLGSKNYNISGDHFMLVGDAGHLVDPLTGEGIGNAIYSGWIAAELAEKCFEQNNFSASFMKAYDKRVNRVLGVEMKLSYQLQRLLAYPWLLNIFAKKLNGSKKLMDILSRMYTDFELRKQLVNPVFWVRVIAGRN